MERSLPFPDQGTRFATRMGKVGHWINRLFAAMGMVVVLVTVTPIVSWWAHAYSGSLDQPKGDVLIVLSAAADDHNLVSFSSYWRARYALLAWQSGGFRKIVISGYASPGILNFLVAEGIPRQAIVSEWQSNSTRENGLYAVGLVKSMPGRKVLLTSDYHMYRAIRVFRNLGIDVVPMPVPDVLKTTQHWNGRFPAFETMVVESTKIIYYRLHGWI